MSEEKAVVRAEITAVTSVEDFMPLMTVQQAVQRKSQITEFIDKVLRPDIDYGVIPGANQKPVLLKPGAEKLCSIFGLAPYYEAEQVTEDWIGAEHNGEPFFYYRYKCRLFRGERSLGEAVGSANSWEAKYRYRDQKRVCPECGQQAIVAGKQEWGGGWLCWKKQGGCGFKFESNDKRITEQPIGRVPNPDVSDQVNTIQKMAQKRALVAVILVVTNCSDAFTQDLEDIDTGGAPRNTQVAADKVAERKINGAKQAELVPEELVGFFAGIDKAENGAFTAACKFVQDEMIMAGGIEQGNIFNEHGKVLRKANPNGIGSEAGKRFLKIMWVEVERLRKLKADNPDAELFAPMLKQREAQQRKDDDESGFAVAR